MGLLSFFIKTGVSGGLARVVAQNFKDISNSFSGVIDLEKRDIFEIVINNRYKGIFKSDEGNKRYLISQIKKMDGFLDLCSYINNRCFFEPKYP